MVFRRPARSPLGLSGSAGYRYVREAAEVLASLAPSPAQVMRAARRPAFVNLGGTLLPIDRIAADTPYCSGEHKRHSMNVQALTCAAAFLAVAFRMRRGSGPRR